LVIGVNQVSGVIAELIQKERIDVDELRRAGGQAQAAALAAVAVNLDPTFGHLLSSSRQ